MNIAITFKDAGTAETTCIETDEIKDVLRIRVDPENDMLRVWVRDGRGSVVFDWSDVDVLDVEQGEKK